jgi:hypothetical protein
MTATKLHNLDLPWKLLLTFFLLVLSSGFVVSELYLKHVTEMADEVEGLSLRDITLTFHGDKTNTVLKKQVLGGMKKFFQEDKDLARLTPQDQADIDAVIAWNDAGAPEHGFWDPTLKDKDKNPRAIINIFYENNCLDCHAPGGKKKDSPLDSYAATAKFTKPDTGMDKGRLLMLSHVHLLGMGMMFLILGAAVAMSIWPAWLRCALIVGGLVSVLIDIFGWWGVKYGGPAWSPVVLASGVLMAVAFGGSVFVAIFDLWLRKRTITANIKDIPTV